jgi:predicted transcriptional regulator
MRSKTETAMATRNRVSQTAPAFISTSHQAWEDALSDPKFKASLNEGLADLAAGRTRPWGEIRTRGQSS